jgi:SAM-dependent methyltransferase
MMKVQALYEEFPFPYRGNHDDLLARYVFPSIPRPPRRILDAGCGTGNLAAEMAQHFPTSRLTGIDFTNASLERAKTLARETKLENAEFMRHDLMEPFPQALRENPFDFAMSIGVLMCTPEPERCLRNLRPVVASDGLFMILVYGKHGRIEVELERDLVDHLRQVTGKSNRELLELHNHLAAEPALRQNRYRKLAPITPRVAWSLLRHRASLLLKRGPAQDHLEVGQADQFIHPLVHNWTAKRWIRAVEDAGFALDHFVYDRAKKYDPTGAGWCIPSEPLSRIADDDLRSLLAAMDPRDQYEAFDLIFRPMLHVMVFRPV